MSGLAQEETTPSAFISSAAAIYPNSNLYSNGGDEATATAATVTTENSAAVDSESAEPPEKKPTKRRKKWATPSQLESTGRPKRPLSAYNLFFHDARIDILNSKKTQEELENDPDLPTDDKALAANGKRKRRVPHGKITFAALGKEISARWKAIKPDKLDGYKQRAAKDMERYKKEIEEYNIREERRRAEERMMGGHPHNAPPMGNVAGYNGYPGYVPTMMMPPEHGGIPTALGGMPGVNPYNGFTPGMDGSMQVPRPDSEGPGGGNNSINMMPPPMGVMPPPPPMGMGMPIASHPYHTDPASAAAMGMPPWGHYYPGPPPPQAPNSALNHSNNGSNGAPTPNGEGSALSDDPNNGMPPGMNNPNGGAAPGPYGTPDAGYLPNPYGYAPYPGAPPHMSIYPPPPGASHYGYHHPSQSGAGGPPPMYHHEDVNAMGHMNMPPGGAPYGMPPPPGPGHQRNHGDN